MNLSLSDEQQMLKAAAVDALSRIDTLAGARDALDGAPPLDLWPTARDAGWTGLLVPERHGGAGLGLFDAMLVLEQCGRRMTGAGLLGHLCATTVLSDAPELAAGDKRAAIVHARPPAGDEGWSVQGIVSGDKRAPVPRLDDDGTVTGSAGFQPDLAGADVIVVPALDDQGELHAVLLDSPEVERVVRGDASRPLGSIELGNASGTIISGDRFECAWYTGHALLAADALGVSSAVLDLAVEYSKDRHAFGRPIGSYQAIKQQIVEILRHVDTTRSLCFYAGLAAEDRREELALAASAARFAGEQAADYGTRTCIAVHGGIGATWEHDAPLYWRRAQLSRLLLGGIDEAGDRVAEEILAAARTAATNEGAPRA